jgi:hypothetical protein
VLSDSADTPAAHGSWALVMRRRGENALSD